MHTRSNPQTCVPAPGTDGQPAKAGVQRSGCTHTKIHQLARRVSQHYDAELAKVGLKTTQYWLLTEVLARGPVRPSDLAEAMSLSPSTLTRNLKPVVASGWLDLGPGIDGRTRSVRITPEGRRKCVEGQHRWIAAQASVHHLIGGRNVSALHALVEDCLVSMSATE